MSATSPAISLLGQFAYHFSLIAPYLPTYLHLIASALFPIYVGAHASLSRPYTAAKPSKRKHNRHRHGDGKPEYSTKMEGLSPWDALLYPLMTGCMLAGLYFLIKWLQDPAILNKILNWYLSMFGVFSISKLLTDSMATITSFVFPSRFSEGGVVWKANERKRCVEACFAKEKLKRTSPLPGILSRITLPGKLEGLLWDLRQFPQKSLLNFETHIESAMYASVDAGPQGLVSLFIAITSVLYYNLIDKPWWLTNLLGFSFSYGALQMMSPTTFWTGTLILTSLFFYDIYFVFFTPMMISVATKLDIPVKLLFPRPRAPGDVAGKQALSMLGLGDVVLPGIMIGLALRFDLYIFYLKKQQRRFPVEQEEKSDEGEAFPEALKPVKGLVLAPLIYDEAGLGKAEYKPAKGAWGERFWLGKGLHQSLEGGNFPKTYFRASLVGYVLGMVSTVTVMHLFKHGQPALLYLVPGVLLSLWGTALVKGDLPIMWNYSEAEEEDAKDTEKAKKKPATMKAGIDGKETEERREKHTSEALEDKEKAKTSSSTASSSPVLISTTPKHTESTLASSSDEHPLADQSPARLSRTFFSFSISRPRLSNKSKKPSTKVKLADKLEDSVKLIADGQVDTTETESDESASEGFSSSRREFEEGTRGVEPMGKRRRVG